MSWRLSSCRTDCDGQKVYIVNSTILDGLSGLVINGIEITGKIINPDYCWKILETDEVATLELTSFHAFYSNCDYCVCGCCTEGIPVASVCATLDMTTVDLTLLGVDDTLEVTFIGPTSNLILATIQGDFSGFTIAQLIAVIVSGVLNGGSGFSAQGSGTDVIICTPADLGTTPIGSSVTITFTPIYYLKNEAQNLGNFDIGYTATISGDAQTNRPAFVPASESGYANDLLYVPNGDTPSGATIPYAAGDWLVGGIPFPFTEDYTAGAGPYITPIPPGLSTFIYVAPNQFQVSLGGFVAIGTITGYNSGTGNLSYTVVLVAGVFPAGNQNFNFSIRSPGFGTIDVYDILDPLTGTLTLNPASPIEVSVGIPLDSYYDSVSGCVFFTCQGSGLNSAGVVKVDVINNPFIVDAYLKNTGGFNNGQKFNMNPVTNNFYWNCGNNGFLKFGKASAAGLMTQYAFGASLTFLDAPYNVALSLTFDTLATSPTAGEVYYTGATRFVYKLQANLNPLIKDAFGLGTAPPNPLIDFSDFNGPPALTDPLQTVQNVNPEGLFYYPPLKRLFVMRSLSTPSNYEFQSYQIHDLITGAQLSNAQINASKIVYPFPAFAAPVGSTCGGLPGGPTCGGKLTFQPGVDQIFITAATNFVIIFDPATGQFSTQIVAQCNGISQFAYRDDQATPNFYAGYNAGLASPQVPDWLSVVSIRTPASLVSGIFIGELNCSPCLPEEVIIFQRSIPDPVKIFYQIKESTCDINVIQRFSGGFWSKLKELRYGITDCCKNINLESLWVSKQISDLDQMLIPDITCRAVPTPGCCPWLPTQACQLIPDPSGGTSIVGVAGEDIVFGKLVMLTNNGKFYMNQPADTSTYQRAVGFTTLDAVTNQQVRILISGQLVNTGWSLIPGAIYYAAINGGITSSIPVSGISQVVGIALSFNTLMVEIKQPIII